MRQLRRPPFKKEVEIETPVAVAKTKVISGRKLALFQFLRAGLGMVDGVMRMVPAAKLVTSACTAILKPICQWNITASSPSDIGERDVIVLIRCLRPAVPRLMPLRKSRPKGAKKRALYVYYCST